MLLECSVISLLCNCARLFISLLAYSYFLRRLEELVTESERDKEKREGRKRERERVRGQSDSEVGICESVGVIVSIAVTRLLIFGLWSSSVCDDKRCMLEKVQLLTDNKICSPDMFLMFAVVLNCTCSCDKYVN